MFDLELSRNLIVLSLLLNVSNYLMHAGNAPAAAFASHRGSGSGASIARIHRHRQEEAVHMVHTQLSSIQLGQRKMCTHVQRDIDIDPTQGNRGLVASAASSGKAEHPSRDH